MSESTVTCDPLTALAKAGYAAYAHAVGGTTHDEKPMPSWYELGERQVRGWRAFAGAVRARVQPTTRPLGADEVAAGPGCDLHVFPDGAPPAELLRSIAEQSCGRTVTIVVAADPAE